MILSRRKAAFLLHLGPDFKHEAPIPLFPNKYIGQFDVHPSGDKFLMLKQALMNDEKINKDTAPKIKVITNWFEELKERVPVD